MIKIVCSIEIVGRNKRLSALKDHEVIPRGTLMQAGLKRKIPDVDNWVYHSPRYQLNNEYLEADLIHFLSIHYKLKEYFYNQYDGVDFAYLSIATERNDAEDEFSCHLNYNIVKLLQHLGLGIDITPTQGELDALLWSEVKHQFYCPDSI